MHPFSNYWLIRVGFVPLGMKTLLLFFLITIAASFSAFGQFPVKGEIVTLENISSYVDQEVAIKVKVIKAVNDRTQNFYGFNYCYLSTKHSTKSNISTLIIEVQLIADMTYDPVLLKNIDEFYVNGVVFKEKDYFKIIVSKSTQIVLSIQQKLAIAKTQEKLTRKSEKRLQKLTEKYNSLKRPDEN